MKNIAISQPLTARFDEMQPEHFGIMLLGCVYETMSAYAVFDDSGRVAAFKLFDTTFGSEVFKDMPKGRAAIFSNHPTGNMLPTPEDIKNARLAGAQLYIVCEGECRAIDQ